MSEIDDTAGALVPPPLTFFGGLILGLLIGYVFPVSFVPGFVGLLVSVPLIALGILVAGSALRRLSRSGTSPDPSEPTTRLVREGVYRLTRNPVYLAFALIYLGLALAFSSVWALAVLVPVLLVIDRNQIAREEKYLERRFGEEYSRYKAEVRRWI